jgi:hypothetical protein
MRGKIRKLAATVSSKGFLLCLVGLWVIYYVTFAVWSKEAFARFVTALNSNPLAQAFFIILLISAFLNLLRASVRRFRESRLMFSLWILLPAGLMVFLTGFFMSAAFRQHEWLVKGDGEIVQPKWQEKPYVVSAIIPSLKDEMLDIDSGSGIFQYEPKVVLDTEEGMAKVGVFPPRNIGGTYYHVLQFGMAPGIRLLDGEEVLQEGHMLQRILPPGAQDGFSLPPHPYRFFLRIAPDRTVTKGRTKAKVYNIRNPSYVVTVLKGENTIFEGDSRQGVEFDGLSLTFTEPTYWVLIEAAKDPGLAVIVCGVALVAAGAPLMLVFMALRIRGRRAD